MRFTPEIWVFLSLALGLQGYAVWKLKAFPSLRWLMSFYILRDLSGIIAHGNQLWYWDVFWYSGQICSVWWVWIACELSFPEMPRFARIPAFVAACVCIFYSPLTSYYSELKYAEAHIYGMAFVALVIGFISGLVAESHSRWALAMVPVCACLGGLALWAWYFGSARISMEAWLGCLLVLILCESKSRGLSGTQPPPLAIE